MLFVIKDRTNADETESLKVVEANTPEEAWDSVRRAFWQNMPSFDNYENSDFVITQAYLHHACPRILQELELLEPTQLLELVDLEHSPWWVSSLREPETSLTHFQRRWELTLKLLMENDHGTYQDLEFSVYSKDGKPELYENQEPIGLHQDMTVDEALELIKQRWSFDGFW
jgi:hypothetical protein